MNNFHKCLTQFQEFLRENDIESVVPIQYELTYINHIPKCQGWYSLSEIGKLFPDFSFRDIKDRFLPEPEDINWRMSFPFPDQAGRLHVTIRQGVSRETLQPLISLQLNARGFSNILEKWFDLAHKWIVYGFSDLTELEVQKQIWKRKD
ncbi:MAG: hypothetical protein NTY64_24610 [Deltaproteobacteria bacterium]|nr:hypothetical protein [Deltaproteobacteria bacterium]